MPEVLSTGINGKFRFWLKALAPVFAVLIFWVGVQNAWLAILAYHAQIIAWALVEKRKMPLGSLQECSWFVFPAIGVGFISYFLIPLFTKVEVSHWLSDYGLQGASFALMVGYFGLIHPFIEQRHWRLLCKESSWAHALFAGYHTIVLASLMPWFWVLAAFVILWVASLYWDWLYRRGQGILAPYLVHLFADFGLIVAVYALIVT